MMFSRLVQVKYAVTIKATLKQATECCTVCTDRHCHRLRLRAIDLVFYTFSLYQLLMEIGFLTFQNHKKKA
jgi:hypothetical protein